MCDGRNSSISYPCITSYQKLDNNLFLKWMSNEMLTYSIFTPTDTLVVTEPSFVLKIYHLQYPRLISRNFNHCSKTAHTSGDRALQEVTSVLSVQCSCVSVYKQYTVFLFCFHQFPLSVQCNYLQSCMSRPNVFSPKRVVLFFEYYATSVLSQNFKSIFYLPPHIQPIAME